MKLVSIFIAVLTFLSCDSLIAQNYWQRVQVGGLLDESYDLIPTSDNGSIACGTVNSNFNQDTYIVKFDEFGNIEWERVIDRDQGGLYEIAVQLLELEDHYFIAVAGSGSSFFADILKLNFDGELVSERRNEGFDISNLLLASDNEIYAFQRDIFGASNILAKYNSDLVEQWTLELANTTFNIIDSYSFVNAEGNFQMVSNVEGLNPSTVEVSPDGAIVSEVIAGETLGLLGDLVLSHDLDDNRLVVVGAGRINNQNDGIRVLDNTMSTLESISLTTQFYDVRAVDVFEDRIYVAGRADGDISTARICVYSDELRLQEVIDLTFLNEEVPNLQTPVMESLRINEREELIITGSYQVEFANSGRFFAYLNKSGGLQDISFVTDNSIEQKLNVFPNPSSHLLYLDTEENIQGRSYVIYNHQGVKIQSSVIKNSQLDISELIPGSYNLLIFTDDNFTLSNFIKAE